MPFGSLFWGHYLPGLLGTTGPVEATTESLPGLLKFIGAFLGSLPGPFGHDRGLLGPTGPFGGHYRGLLTGPFLGSLPGLLGSLPGLLSHYRGHYRAFWDHYRGLLKSLPGPFGVTTGAFFGSLPGLLGSLFRGDSGIRGGCTGLI